MIAALLYRRHCGIRLMVRGPWPTPTPGLGTTLVLTTFGRPAARMHWQSKVLARSVAEVWQRIP